jgi:hypothetical protein
MVRLNYAEYVSPRNLLDKQKEKEKVPNFYRQAELLTRWYNLEIAGSAYYGIRAGKCTNFIR